MEHDSILVAPCGINCRVCMAYLRKRNKCNGCTAVNTRISKSCDQCRIKNCEMLAPAGRRFCSECPQFPCKRLKDIDRRYRTRYGMSLIRNLEDIRELGLEAFEKAEAVRWRCGSCGGVVCVHTRLCSSCGKAAEKAPETAPHSPAGR